MRSWATFKTQENSIAYLSSDSQKWKTVEMQFLKNKKLKRTKQYQLPLILTTPGTQEKYLQKLKGKEEILKSREGPEKFSISGNKIPKQKL